MGIGTVVTTGVATAAATAAATASALGGLPLTGIFTAAVVAGGTAGAVSALSFGAGVGNGRGGDGGVAGLFFLAASHAFAVPAAAATATHFALRGLGFI
jgi:hypothetical protein